MKVNKKPYDFKLIWAYSDAKDIEPLIDNVFNGLDYKTEFINDNSNYSFNELKSGSVIVQMFYSDKDLVYSRIVKFYNEKNIGNKNLN